MWPRSRLFGNPSTRNVNGSMSRHGKCITSRKTLFGGPENLELKCIQIGFHRLFALPDQTRPVAPEFVAKPPIQLRCFAIFRHMVRIVRNAKYHQTPPADRPDRAPDRDAESGSPGKIVHEVFRARSRSGRWHCCTALESGQIVFEPRCLNYPARTRCYGKPLAAKPVKVIACLVTQNKHGFIARAQPPPQ